MTSEDQAASPDQRQHTDPADALALLCLALIEEFQQLEVKQRHIETQLARLLARLGPEDPE